MNDESGQQQPPGGAGGQPSEEELRRQLEAEMAKVRVQDMLLQSVANLANLSARRIAKEDERDLEQAKVGIEAVRALVDLLEPEPQQQVRQAISELQMLYAKHAGGDPGGEGPDEATGESAGGEAPPSQPQPGAPSGPAQGGERKPPPGLWTPPGS